MCLKPLVGLQRECPCGEHGKSFAEAFSADFEARCSRRNPKYKSIPAKVDANCLLGTAETFTPVLGSQREGTTNIIVTTTNIIVTTTNIFVLRHQQSSSSSRRPVLFNPPSPTLPDSAFSRHGRKGGEHACRKQQIVGIRCDCQSRTTCDCRRLTKVRQPLAIPRSSDWPATMVDLFASHNHDDAPHRGSCGLRDRGGAEGPGGALSEPLIAQIH
jgi:hypothetical protein